VTTTRTTRLIGSTLAGILVLVATGASASAEPASVTIGPEQAFIGLVNGTHPKATIKVVCPGPVLPPPATQTGHPLSGQTLGVMPEASTSTTTGWTGSRGRSIAVLFVTPVDAPTVPVTFTRYGTQALPTSLLLPCSGSTPVVFSPQPTSKTARSASVLVTYENIAVTPTPTASGSTIPTHTITVTWADNQQSYSLQKGNRLDVELSGPSSGFTWTEPTSSNSAVLKRRSGSSGEEADGLFLAVGSGKATVMALGSPKCSPQCETAVLLLFEVKVTVTG